MPGVAVLPQAVGYAVVTGIGFFFAALMLGLSRLFNRYSETKSGLSEEFTSASRSVNPGLVAASLVSAWTWAATLSQSSAVGYKLWFGTEHLGVTCTDGGLLITVELSGLGVSTSRLSTQSTHLSKNSDRVSYGACVHIMLFSRLIFIPHINL